MKLATSMALLEIGGYTLDTKVNTEHSNSKRGVKIGNATVYDTHDAGEGTDGNITLVDAFAHSSNVYYAKAVYEKWKDNPEQYTEFLADIGFGDYVGMEKYGEAEPYLPMAGTAEWNKDGSTSSRLPRMAYGYELTIPPIHMATFYNGVANDGRMVAPRLVDRIECDGTVLEVMPTVVLNKKMCSKRTLELLDSCLVAGTTRTSGKFRDLPTSFGCKTGTAQLWGAFPTLSPTDTLHFREGFGKDKHLYYLGSLVAVMPLDNPKYTIMVALAKEKTDSHPNYYGISLTGGVMHDIIEFLHTNDLSLHESVESVSRGYTPTMIKRGRATSVNLVAETLCNINYNNGFDTEWCSASVDDGGETRIESLSIESGRVPNVLGMGLNDALFLLEQQGLSVTHSGYGRVLKQSLDPGLKITNSEARSGSRGHAIHLTLGN
jgi:cell division protein FtsI (penicillin-binding protein 3)